jgi:hypothetical protein
VTTYYYTSPYYYTPSANIPVQSYSSAIYPYANSGVPRNSAYTYVESPYVNYVPTNNPAQPYYYTTSPYLNYVPSNDRASPYSYASYPYVNYVPLQR